MFKGRGSSNLEKLNKVIRIEEDEDRKYERKYFGGYYNREKLRNSLWEINEHKLFEKIDNCNNGRSSFCGSLWCERCRNKISGILENKVTKHINRLCLEGDDVRMVTGVIGLSSFSVNDVVRTLKRDGNRWKKIKRRMDEVGRKGFITVGYEFELVNGSFMFYGLGDGKYGLGDKERKKENFYKREMIERISEDKKFCDEDVDLRKLFLFNHFHGLSNFNDEELKFILGDLYFVNGKKLKRNNDCGWYVNRLDKSKEFDVNVKKICSYGFKSVYRFKYNFIGSDFNNGEYMNLSELGNLIKLYDVVSGRGYRRLFRNYDNID